MFREDAVPWGGSRPGMYLGARNCGFTKLLFWFMLENLIFMKKNSLSIFVLRHIVLWSNIILCKSNYLLVWFTSQVLTCLSCDWSTFDRMIRYLGGLDIISRLLMSK